MGQRKVAERSGTCWIHSQLKCKSRPRLERRSLQAPLPDKPALRSRPQASVRWCVPTCATQAKLLVDLATRFSEPHPFRIAMLGGMTRSDRNHPARSSMKQSRWNIGGQENSICNRVENYSETSRLT